jgi:hypothetical protein
MHNMSRVLPSRFSLYVVIHRTFRPTRPSVRLYLLQISLELTVKSQDVFLTPDVRPPQINEGLKPRQLQKIGIAESMA